MGKLIDSINPAMATKLAVVKNSLPKSKTDKVILDQRRKANVIIGSVPDNIKTDSRTVKTILRKKKNIIKPVEPKEKLTVLIPSPVIPEIKEKTIFKDFNSKETYTDSGMLTIKGLVFKFWQMNRDKTIKPIAFALQETLKDKSLFDKQVEKQLYKSFDSLCIAAMNKAKEEKITRDQIKDYLISGIRGIEKIHFDNLSYLDI
jgi:hypothetical protein